MLKGVRLFVVAVPGRPPTTRWTGQAALEEQRGPPIDDYSTLPPRLRLSRTGRESRLGHGDSMQDEGVFSAAVCMPRAVQGRWFSPYILVLAAVFPASPSGRGNCQTSAVQAFPVGFLSSTVARRGGLPSTAFAEDGPAARAEPPPGVETARPQQFMQHTSFVVRPPPNLQP